MDIASNFKKIKKIILLPLLIFVLQGYSQTETSKWKFQIAFGVNSPFDDNKSDQFSTKGLNFPTINLGVQHMFNPDMGAKLDFGYNRSVNDNDSPEFKLNYTRINAQFVYDFKSTFRFLPPRIVVVGHAGPGVSFSKPLGSYSNNTYTYLNGMAGLEFHYGVARLVSIYTDVSYIMGLSGKDKYDPVINGFSFNGDMLTLTVGVSVSLSGCYFCD